MASVIVCVVLATIFAALAYDAGGGMIPGMLMLMAVFLSVVADWMALMMAIHHHMPWWGFVVVVVIPIIVHIIGSQVWVNRSKAWERRKQQEQQ